MASINASLHSSIESMDAVTSLSDDVSSTMMQLLAISADVADSAAEADAADIVNAQSALNRDAAVAAVDEVRQALNSLDPADSSRLQELRLLIGEVRAQYEDADLSGVYQALMERLVMQRAVREGLQAELEELNADIEHLRQVRSVLPTGCNEGA